MKNINNKIEDNTNYYVTKQNLLFTILSIIKEKGNVYGYEIMLDINKTMCCRLPSGGLYGVLSVLEDCNMIVSFGEHQFNRRRKYFKITQKGEEYLLKLQNSMSTLLRNFAKGSEIKCVYA